LFLATIISFHKNLLVGLYADISKEFNYSGYIPHQFEHENIAEAELVIERRKKQFKHNF
jgi:hypothetical protein